MNPFDVRAAGDGALLLQFAATIDPEVNTRVIAIAAAVRKHTLRGVRDVVSTFRSVAVHFDPLSADLNEISTVLRQSASTPPRLADGRRHEIPVVYGGGDGPDLEEVAANAGVTADEVIRRHAALPYRVYMLGFQPGFAYLGLVDASIATPRRAVPRLRVASGSVGIAGCQTGIYPAASPAGWQIVGRALEAVIDETFETPRFRPGDTVVFVPVRRPEAMEAGGLQPGPPPGEDGRGGAPLPVSEQRCVTILRPGLFTTVQNRGEWGRQNIGFPVSGAMDVVSHALANQAVGNGPDAAALEITIAGPELRVEQGTTLAVAGADLSAAIDGNTIPLHTPITVRAGRVLRFGERVSGTRAYVAFNGGVQVERRWPVVPLIAGQVLALNWPANKPSPAVTACCSMPAGGARLRVIVGPQDDQLPRGAFDALVRSRFIVSPQSNRIGYRLTGATIPSDAGEMISDATFPGGVQIPPSGEPILLMADRQTTGGYPQVATVISADMPIAGQLAPGDWVEFVATTRAEAIAALEAQEAMRGDVP